MFAADRSRLLAASREVANVIVAGELTPYEGARRIAALCRGADGHPPLELHAFIYADSEWDERPDDSNVFAEGVVAAAHDLVRTNAS
jgi:hypothetical protein